jgi:hypothetical protein
MNAIGLDIIFSRNLILNSSILDIRSQVQNQKSPHRGYRITAIPDPESDLGPEAELIRRSRRKFLLGDSIPNASNCF